MPPNYSILSRWLKVCLFNLWLPKAWYTLVNQDCPSMPTLLVFSHVLSRSKRLCKQGRIQDFQIEGVLQATPTCGCGRGFVLQHFTVNVSPNSKSLWFDSQIYYKGPTPSPPSLDPALHLHPDIVRSNVMLCLSTNYIRNYIHIKIELPSQKCVCRGGWGGGGGGGGGGSPLV